MVAHPGDGTRGVVLAILGTEERSQPLDCSLWSLQLFNWLKRHRLTEAWLLKAAIHRRDHAHVTLMAVRLLLRDEQFQHLLMTGGEGGASQVAGRDALMALRKLLSHLVSVHFSSAPSRVGRVPPGGVPPEQDTTDLLKEVTSESVMADLNWLELGWLS